MMYKVVYKDKDKDEEPRNIWASTDNEVVDLVGSAGKTATILEARTGELVAMVYGQPTTLPGPYRCGECGWETAYTLPRGDLGCHRCGWRGWL